MKTKNEWYSWYLKALLEEARLLTPPVTQLDLLPYPQDRPGLEQAMEEALRYGWRYGADDGDTLTLRHDTWRHGDPGHIIQAPDLSKLGGG